ncbi:hypothetical protein GCM10022247_36010 [Allokutzneria multivorans]|uniref:N-acetyltransferase domain-containing protein n=1 Tax=Allokutzneria multivorans TaxID=1142134 RepID=A0ABP7SEP2_9PSEU
MTTIIPLRVHHIPQVIALMDLGAPFIRARTHSDYWAYSALFSSTCPLGEVNGEVVGSVIAMRSQDNPEEIYVQDVMVHPEHRRTGITAALLGQVREQAVRWGCRRLWLTSEPGNAAAHAAWTALGFLNVSGDYEDNGVWVKKDFKGPGKDRAVYELLLSN